MRKHFLSLITPLIIFALGGVVQAEMAGEISQYGITFTFDRPYETGRFANGDYWVAPAQPGGTVTITEMTPAFDGEHNGWMVNVSTVTKQGYDAKARSFDASLVPKLPYKAKGGESIIKAISVGFFDGDAKRYTPENRIGVHAFLETAAVLTVLDEPPAGGGEGFFRPPYFGKEKPLYAVDDLHPQKLPALSGSGVDSVPSLDDIERRFQRVQIDHLRDWVGRNIHPVQNMPDYGGNIGSDIGEAALRLMLDGSPADKMPALVNFVQYGIDLYHIMLGGGGWPPNGGHCIGRKMPIAMTAVLLDNDEMKQALADADYKTFHEVSSVYFSPVAGVVLWGQPLAGEDQYWGRLLGTKGAKTIRDPYQYIDGGMQPGGSYQLCCTTQPYKPHALAAHLMPELREVLDNEPLLDYLDRWVHFGAWTQPDPYDPKGRGEKDTDSSDGIGRFPQVHGTKADEGGYRSKFADAMWAKFRPRNAAAMPVIEPYGGTLSAGAKVTLKPSPRQDDAGVTIRYTLDGTMPTEDSPLYEQPFTLERDATVRARAFKGGLEPSAANEATFEAE